jgi:hypothetical protein
MDRAVGRFTSTLPILLSLTFGSMHHLSQPRPAPVHDILSATKSHETQMQAPEAQSNFN